MFFLISWCQSPIYCSSSKSTLIDIFLKSLIPPPSSSLLVDDLASYFIQKIKAIGKKLRRIHIATYQHLPTLLLLWMTWLYSKLKLTLPSIYWFPSLHLIQAHSSRVLPYEGFFVVLALFKLPKISPRG